MGYMPSVGGSHDQQLHRLHAGNGRRGTPLRPRSRGCFSRHSSGTSSRGSYSTDGGSWGTRKPSCPRSPESIRRTSARSSTLSRIRPSRRSQRSPPRCAVRSRCGPFLRRHSRSKRDNAGPRNSRACSPHQLGHSAAQIGPAARAAAAGSGRAMRAPRAAAESHQASTRKARPTTTS